jgi:hypothetical protein
MNPLKDRLKEELKPLYQKLIKHTQEYCEGKDIFPFIIQWGKDFPSNLNTGLMFVGRATNGWLNEDLDVENMFDESSEERIFNRSNQMTWISKNDDENYNTNHSAFFRVMRRVAQEFYPIKDEVNYIAWSNLCKLAPDGANPSETLFKLQLNDDCNILKKEVDILSPKCVVMMTGIGWADNFISALNNNEWPEELLVAEDSWAGFPVYVYQIDKHYIILTEHPQGKDEDAHVECLVSIIKKYKL